VFDKYDASVSLILAGLAVSSVFIYIPLVSDFAFWIMFAAYVLLAQHELPKK
jgi:hypothetical protein